MATETATADETFLEGWTLLCPISHPKEKISEYIDGRRKLPDDAPIPGLYHISVTPYAREIMDAMAPGSPVQHGVMMCAAQVVKTTILENICAYYMDELPSPILFVSGTEEGAEKWASTRLEPMIDSIPGLRDKIGPVYNIAKSKKTGDKVFEKLFIGGSLHIVSAQSPSGLASMSKRILLRDEIDRAPSNLRSGEGNWLSVSEARTKAWRYRKKIFDCSTPGDVDVSEINRLYELGDMRMYFVPCPLCKQEQVLEMGDGKEKGLLQIETPRGREVVYICCHCHGMIQEYQKEWMLENGRWQATRKGYSNPAFASWHINALYSPLGLYSWQSIWEKWEIAKDDPSQMKAFVNLELGLPYKDEGSRPDLQIVLSHQGKYGVGEIRPGVLFLTAGMDVQVGKDNPKSPDEGPRLEMEILGHGQDYRTWSIIYRKFYGEVHNPHGGAWEQFYQWAITNDQSIHKGQGFAFIRADGVPFGVHFVFIDSGDNTDIVYQFCQREPKLFVSVKGMGFISDEKKKEKGDIVGPATSRHYAVRQTGGGQQLVDVATNYYKNELYNHLKVQRRSLEPQSPGYCDFPLAYKYPAMMNNELLLNDGNQFMTSTYDEEYFDQLRGAEKRRDGSFHDARIRVEALDCRVYAACAGEVYVMQQLRIMHDAARRAGVPQAEIDLMTPKWLLARWAMQISMKG